MENTKTPIIFLAEVREVKSKKLITNDIEFTLKVNTNDPSILELAKFPADTMIKVSVEISNG
ncbi:MAG: hypothetical protein AAB922_04935 [Patescibacteria group bacterium]